MDRQVAVILKFIDQATPGIQRAASTLGSAFNGVRAATATTTGFMMSAWNKTGGAVIGVMGRLIKQSQLASLFIGGALVGAMGNAINMAAEFERFGKAAEFMTGSADAAEKFAQSVRRLTKETLFNVDEIAKMNSLLIGNTRDVAKSEEVLRSLTSAVTATGGGYDELQGVVRAWIQTNAKGKASAEEMNRQFANANIPVLRLLAEAIVKDADHPLRQYIATANSVGGGGGVNAKLAKSFESASSQMPILAQRAQATEKRLQELKDAGKEGSSTFLSAQATLMGYQEKLAKAEGTINQYNNASKTQVKTTKAVKLTVDDVLGQLQEIGQLNIPGHIAAESITKALNDAYGGANQAMLETFTFQFDKLKDNVKFAALSFAGLDENFKPIEGGLINMLTKAIIPMNKFLDEHSDTIENFFRQFGNSTAGLATVAGILIGAIIPAIAGILGPILVLGAVFGGIGFLIGTVVDAFGGWGVVMGTLQPIFMAVFGFLRDVVVPIIQNVATNLAPLFKQAWEAMLPALQELWQALQNIAPVVAALIVVFAALFTGLMSAALAVIPPLITFITGFINVIAGLFTFLAGLIVGIMTGNWQFLIDGWNMMVQGVVQIVSGFVMTIINFFKGFVEGVIAFFQGLYDALVGHSIIPDMVNAMIQWFFTLKDKLFGVVGQIVGGIKDKFMGLVNAAGDWGKGIITNMINGIKNAIKGAGKLAGKLLEGLGMSMGELMQYEHGGIVPGPLGAPVPILAHGGERITNNRGTDVNGGMGGGVTINFHGPLTIDSDERVRELADRIMRMMGRQNELARYGAGF